MENIEERFRVKKKVLSPLKLYFKGNTAHFAYRTSPSLIKYRNFGKLTKCTTLLTHAEFAPYPDFI